jgi:predicted patatin/cPLA2 family phospholipase
MTFINPSTTRKTALIVEGGVMRGAWAAGVLGALREMKHDQFDLVVAASSGACNAAYFVAGMVEEGTHIWTKCVCGQTMLRKTNWLRFKPIIDLTYLIDHCFSKFAPLPVEVFDRAGCRFEIVLTDCRTGQPVYHVPRSHSVLDALKASASLPFGTRGYSLVEGVPYADGALSDPIPIWHVLEQGATDITVVLTHDAACRPRSTPRWICRLAYPRFPEVAATWRRQPLVHAAALNALMHPPPGVRIRVLRPAQPLPINGFSGECELISAAVHLGRADAFEQLRES